MAGDQKYFYQCISCSKEYPAGEIMYLCPVCQSENRPLEPGRGVLKVVYNYDAIRQERKDFSKLRQNHFMDLLPIEDAQSLPRLKIGDTPLYNISKWGKESLPYNLFLKDDSQNPTFSFKDRASALVSAFAKERGITKIVAASTGNAGSSLAGICAAQGQQAIIMVPETAPLAKLTQIIMYGATIMPVKGNYDDAFDLSVAATAAFGWYNRNTAYNPMTIEGKKTVAFELFEQLGHNTPDRIFVPVGDGVILSGVYKGFEDLMKLGLIYSMPIMVAVQAKGSDNLLRNLNNPVFHSKASSTIADSISVDMPRNFFMARYYLHKYKGEWLTVSDTEIMDAASSLARQSGIFTEPASAAAYAGLLAYQQQQKLENNSSNVVLLTGSGLKDIQSFASAITIPDGVHPDIESLKSFLQ